MLLLLMMIAARPNIPHIRIADWWLGVLMVVIIIQTIIIIIITAA